MRVAILEAVGSGRVPTVAVTRVEPRSLLALHRTREQWMTIRTARINTVRETLREHCREHVLAPSSEGPLKNLNVTPYIGLCHFTPVTVDRLVYVALVFNSMPAVCRRGARIGHAVCVDEGEHRCRCVI